MSCKITYTPDFAKQLKRLAKKYKSMKEDYAQLLAELEEEWSQYIAEKQLTTRLPFASKVSVELILRRYCKTQYRRIRLFAGKGCHKT